MQGAMQAVASGQDGATTGAGESAGAEGPEQETRLERLARVAKAKQVLREGGVEELEVERELKRT